MKITKSLCSVMLALVMTLGLFAAFPTTALAAPVTADYTLRLNDSDGELYKTDTTGAKVTTEMANAGAKVSGSPGAWVLTLTDFNFTSTVRYALNLPGGTTITLNGVNTITSKYAGSSPSRGI